MRHAELIQSDHSRKNEAVKEIGQRAKISATSDKKSVSTELSKELDALIEARDSLAKIDLDIPLREARDSFERIYLSYQLAKLQGSMTRLAQRSGLERTHLYRKIRQLGMELQRGIFKKTQ